MTNVRFLSSTYSPLVCFYTLLSTKSTLREFVPRRIFDFLYLQLHHHPQLSMFNCHGYETGFFWPPANSVKMHFWGLKLNFWRLYLISQIFQLSLDHLDLLNIHPAPDYLSSNLNFQPDFMNG